MGTVYLWKLRPTIFTHYYKNNFNDIIGKKNCTFKNWIVMAKKKEKIVNKGGRPKLELDEAKIEEMAASFLSVEAIARILDCHADSIYARYSDALQRGRENRRYKLACAMWHKALEEKDTKMLIWLSKQHLGYKDVLPEEATQVHFNVYVNEVPK